MNWAYLAGFWDGEGHISIIKPYVSTWIPKVHVGATQCTRNSFLLVQINHFLQRNGIETQLSPVKPGKSNFKNSTGGLQLVVCSGTTNLVKFLSKIKPFLVLKRSKAETALALLTSVRKHGTWLSKEEKWQIYALWQNGMKQKEIIQVTGRSKHSIARLLSSFKKGIVPEQFGSAIEIPLELFH